MMAINVLVEFVMAFMMVGVCDGASFLFFHSPEPMSHARVLHTVMRYEKNVPQSKIMCNV